MMKITKKCEEGIFNALTIIKKAKPMYYKPHGYELMKGVTNDGFIYYSTCWKCESEKHL